MKIIRKLLKIAFIVAILFVLACIVYLGYLFFTVGIPMSVELFYAMLK